MDKKQPATPTVTQILDSFRRHKRGRKWPKQRWGWHEHPEWPCRQCSYGTIKIAPEDRHEKRPKFESPVESLFSKTRPNRRYLAFGQCTSCGLAVTILGFVEVRQYTADEGDDIWECVPLSVVPSPHFISRATDLPDALESLLERAEHLFWMSEEACGNALRTLVESFLSDRGVTPGKPTHQRIESYAATAPTDQAEYLMALKHIGNAGSHGHELTRDDLIFAFELLEKVFSQVYSARDAELAAVVKRVNATKKPPSHGG